MLANILTGLSPAIMISYILYSYDTAFMVVDAINRMINDGIAPNNGTALLHYLYTCTINGISGPISIDSVCLRSNLREGEVKKERQINE